MQLPAEAMGLSCPFCSFSSPQSADNETLAINSIAYHIETEHPEDESVVSPFTLRPPSPQPSASDAGATDLSSTLHSKQSGASDVDDYVPCPLGCGEHVYKSQVPEHIAFHEAEASATPDSPLEISTDPAPGTEIGSAQQKPHGVETSNPSTENDRKIKQLEARLAKFIARARGAVENRLPLEPGQRLGRKELGPYAYEDRMPTWLFRQLEKGAPVTWTNRLGSDGKIQKTEKVANETSDLIPLIASLCRHDKSVSKAWLCSPGVRHIYKMHREGGFCGYRNIQMLISWMQHQHHPGAVNFPGGTPNILKLQELIENAWGSGYNVIARSQTGGIAGTRKFIGTPEAQALFKSLRIFCATKAIHKSKTDHAKEPAYVQLLELILSYFSADITDVTDKVYRTDRPPLYFQHRGHSMTIVGIEVHKDSAANLLVFDPMFATSTNLVRQFHSRTDSASQGRALKSIRRGKDYLQKHRSFEVLSLEAFQIS